jgi:hypothetical protein
MRIFEFTGSSEYELYDGDRLLGVYVPELRYNCPDDETHAVLSKALDRWLLGGCARLIEEIPQSSGPAILSGQGEVR